MSLVSHRGRHFTVENARLYTLPDEAFDVFVAAGGPDAAELAAQIGDGIIATAPDRTCSLRSTVPAEPALVLDR